ncbi:Mbeg1-like protein [Limnohabitans sp. Rim8]|uniref:Mbeg1-like protein n=1 Tax=Limnohabitans sp. Rim8 TaxID=1100718 RepID=UPI002608D6C0|nr:Mbeg1-like protein [Limnohabitans sp. Rim8]
MSNFNLVTDARLGQGSYSSNNQGNTAVIDGWKPVYVDSKDTKFSTTFGAQLYQKDGQYKVVFRGTEGNMADWAQNLKYGSFQWSDEFKDTIAFMAKAVVQVAREEFRGDLELAKARFTTTGHSQGGFQAELAALLFGVKGTSLDGMGATGVAAQFRADLNKVMTDNGAGDLIRAGEKLTLTTEDFLTRIYTAVGRLGVHAGDTDGAWTWSVTKLVAAFNPALIGAIVVGGLRAHMIADIVANEELRVRSPLWRVIGDASDYNNATLLAQNVAGQWSSVQVANSSGYLPALTDTSKLQAQVKQFLQEHAGQNFDQQVLGNNVLVRLANGDSMMIYADGTTKITAKLGDTTTVREYAKDGNLQAARQERLDTQGNTLVSEQGPGYEGSMTVSPDSKVLSAHSTTWQGAQLKTTTDVSIQLVNGQTVTVTETVNLLATGNQVASVKDMITQGGARIINSTTADGHLQEETWASINGKQTLQSSKTISYSQAERNTAAMDVSLAGLEFLQALRHGNKVQAAGSLIRLVNNAEIASNKMPTLGAIGTGFSGAVSLISALDSWGGATDGERIALAARAVLGANEVAKAFSANGQTGFLNSAPGATALNVAGGIVALAGLEDTLHSGNPFAIASSAMALTNAAVATGMVSSATAAGAFGTTAFSTAAVFGPEAMIAMAIASIIFGGLFGGSVQYPAPPPAGTVEVGALADGSLGMLFKDGDDKTYQTRYLWGGVYSDTYKATDKRDWGLGADILSQRMLGLIGELNAQAAKDGTHLVLDRLPTLTVIAYPSFDRNGVDNFFFDMRMNDNETGEQKMGAAASQDLNRQYKELAAYAGAMVNATEWAQIQMKQASGDAASRTLATEAYGQYVDRLSGPAEADSLLTLDQQFQQKKNNKQTYTLMTLDLEGDGISRKTKQTAGLNLDAVMADTTQARARLDVDNDGYMELTEWVGAKEAILGMDRNGDGVLNSAEELFNGAELSDAAEGLGLRRLAFFDANKDGQINALDPYFNAFKLWVDINGDARTGVGELHGLTDAGVKSINVNSGAVSFSDGQTLTLQQTQLTAEVTGVAVSAVSDGKGGVLAGQYKVQQEGNDAEMNISVGNINPTVRAVSTFYAWEDGHYAANNQDSNARSWIRLQNFLGGVGAQDANNDALTFGEFKHGNHITDIQRDGNDVILRFDQNYSGSAGFDYRVRDSKGGWTDGQVNFNVMAQNDRPWLYGLPGWSSSSNMSEKMGGEFTNRIYASDVDGRPEDLRAGIADSPLHGDVALTQEGTGISAGSGFLPVGKSLSSGTTAFSWGTTPPSWDLSYKNHYGDEATGDVSFSVDVSDQQGGWARQYVQTFHQGSVASRGGKPVAIDLNGDGIHYSNLDDSKVLFDINGDGVKDLLAWTAADDGLVVFDKNGDGLIQDVDEVSFLSYLTGAMTDLEGLSGFDTDKDGKLTAKDALWSKFGVWQDKNQNGVTDDGEFKGLEAWGIKSIDLTSDQMMDQLGDVYIMGKSTFERTDGSKGEIADAAFRYLDAADTSGKSQPKTFNIDIEAVIRKRLADAHTKGASDAELNAMLQRFISDVANAGNKQIEIAESETSSWTEAMFAEQMALQNIHKQQALST